VRAGMVDMESNVTLVQNFPAHQAVPEGEGPFPAVIVFHDRFGLTPQVRGVANRLAREGYHVLAPNFYALTSSFSTLAPQFMKGVGVGYFEYGEEAAAASRRMSGPAPVSTRLASVARGAFLRGRPTRCKRRRS
jgi:dienelactone hydrolase